MRLSIAHPLLVTLVLVVSVGPASGGQSPLPAPERATAREILKELIEINTTPTGSTRRAAEAVAKRLRAGGFADGDIAIVGPDGERKNLVVRLHGSSPTQKALLLLAHLDVVEALRADWSSDPFTFREDSGSFYGRGTNDNKSGAAMLVANMLRWKRDGFVPDRDVIVLLTTDEETDGSGMIWMIKNRRDLIDAEYCLNTDGGMVTVIGGKPRAFILGASEKVFQNFTLEVRNKGGHSSLPRPDNAITQLARGLAKLGDFSFPVQTNEVTKAMFRSAATLEKGQLAVDMKSVAEQGGAARGAVHRLSQSAMYNSLLRTTCVATLLQGGHADNALPQLATANVNCRMFPGSTPEEVRRVIVRIVADSGIGVRTAPPDAMQSPPSPLRPELMRALDDLTARFWPGAAVVPSMETGASDGLFLRNAGIPTYNAAALAENPNDVRAHGRDERVGQEAYYNSVQFWYEMVRRLTGASPRA